MGAIVLLSALLWNACSTPAPRRPLPAQPSPILWLSVRPLVALAPSDIFITLRIAPHPENRSFAVSMAAPDGAYRLSAETLHGAAAPVFYSWWWFQMPQGEYEVRADLYGVNARRRATARQSVLLQ